MILLRVWTIVFESAHDVGVVCEAAGVAVVVVAAAAPVDGRVHERIDEHAVEVGAEDERCVLAQPKPARGLLAAVLEHARLADRLKVERLAVERDLGVASQDAVALEANVGVGGRADVDLLLVAYELHEVLEEAGVEWIAAAGADIIATIGQHRFAFVIL